MNDLKFIRKLWLFLLSIFQLFEISLIGQSLIYALQVSEMNVEHMVYK